MKRVRLIGLLVILAISLVFFLNSKPNYDTDQEHKKVHINLISKQNFPEGKAFALKLINGSSLTIKQNSVYVSFPIRMQNGSRSNKCKVEADGNRLDIKPGEEVSLNVFIPKENYEKSKDLDITRPNLEWKAYFNEVKIENRFEKMGEIEHFNEF